MPIALALRPGLVALAVAAAEPPSGSAPDAEGEARLALESIPRHRPVALDTPGGGALTISGYLETYYGYNFNRPSNGLTNFRAFDNRHNALTLENVALDVAWAAPRVYTRIALQVGSTPATYYQASEPLSAGAAGVAPSDPSVLRNVQQAYAGVRPSARLPLFIEAGIFLSSIGFESLAIRDNWHWSYSPLFFALPFYHSGLHVGAEVAPGHVLKAAVYNGWNNVTDNNREKSLALLYDYSPGRRFGLGVVYFSGVERPAGAAEGRAWRHLLNLQIKGAPIRRLGLAGNLNGGVEPNNFGASWWFAGALSARVELFPWLFLAARGSYVGEARAASAAGIAAPLLLPYAGDDPRQWFAAGTCTLDLRPVPDHLSVRVEFRHDHARQPVFFRGDVVGDGSDAAPFLANARTQDTVTVGLNAWF